MFQWDQFYMWHGKSAFECQSFRTIWRYEHNQSKKKVLITDMYNYVYIYKCVCMVLGNDINVKYQITSIFNAFKRGRKLYTDVGDGSPFCYFP